MSLKHLHKICFHRNNETITFTIIIIIYFQVRILIDEAITKNEQSLVLTEKTRSAALREVGNHLHESVPVDDDEDHNKVERTYGDCTFRTKYSHVDLICMIDG